MKFNWINITDFLEFFQQIIEELLHKVPPKMTPMTRKNENDSKIKIC